MTLGIATTATCLLEFMQLWTSDWLTQIRGTRFGVALLGNGFTWSDFPSYFMGGVISFLILQVVARSTGPAREEFAD